MSEARILVVDDDLATRMIVMEALLASGFEVLEAEDGVAALSMFEAHRPDALLLDLSMPNLDGYDVCTQIRQLFGNTEVPIMVMTASDDVDAVERAFAAGATDFMTKPVNLPLLPYRMRYMLRSAHATEVMREIGRRLVQSQALARLVHWHVHADGEFEWANDPMPTLWPGGIPGITPPDLLELVHPEDRARVSALLASRSKHEAEFRIVLPDGTERTMLQHAAVGDLSLGIALVGATQDVTNLKRAERQVARLAYYDDLTGIPNRRLIDRYVETNPETPRFAIAIELGTARTQVAEPVRDRLIRAAAARVIERVRRGDHGQRLDAVPRPVESFGPTIVGRSGPDELLVVSSGENAAEMLRAIEGSLSIPFTMNESAIQLSARIGMAAFPSPVANASELPDAARSVIQPIDGTIGVYTAAVEARRARAAAIGHSIDLSLACAPHEPCDALSVRYEVRVDRKTSQMIGRRAHPAFDRELGKDIVPLLATDPVRAARVLMWTLTSALREAATWPAPLRLAAALSSTHLAAAGGLQMMESALTEARFDPARLDLELIDLPTSRQDLDAVAVVFAGLHERGIRLGLRIDDHTPLQSLSRLPLAFVRIDPATLDPQLLPAVIAIAETLGIEVAVTGIDSATRRATIASLEVAELSGTLIEGPAVRSAGTVDTCLQARG